MSADRLGVGSSAIQSTLVDAKGDIVTATAADTPAILTVGTNGQYLKADSTTATGLAWATLPASGKVLQVVYAEYSTQTTVATTSFTDTGLSASITPSATSSKILVLVSQQFYGTRSTTDFGHNVRLLRGSTEIFNQGGTTYNYGSGYITVGNGTSTGLAGAANLQYLDSPSTTSSTTYKTQGRPWVTTSSGQVIYQDASAKSSITLLEIGA